MVNKNTKKLIIEKVKELYNNGQKVSYPVLKEHGFTIASIKHHFSSLGNLINIANSNDVDELNLRSAKELSNEEHEKMKHKIIVSATELYEEGKLSFSRLLSKDITRSMVRHYFGSITELTKIIVSGGISSTQSDTTKKGVIGDVSVESGATIIKEVSDETKFYVITAAVNNTPVDKKFWKSLNTFVNHFNAELFVLPLRYKNPTSVLEQQKQEQDEWYSSELVPYLCNNIVQLNDNVIIYGGLKISVTHKTPLNSLCQFSQEKSCIFAHTSIQLKTNPTTICEHAPIHTTTGSVTVPNFSDTLAGKWGEKNHKIAATILVVKGQKFFIRHIIADKRGKFQYLNKIFDGETIKDNKKLEVFSLGDLHAPYQDNENFSACFTDNTSLVKTLNPSTVILDDSVDFHARNHHLEFEHFERYRNFVSNNDSVLDEFDKSVDVFIDILKSTTAKVIFTPSNHPEALEKWAKRADWRNDLKNAKILLRAQLAKLDAIDNNEDINLVEWIVRDFMKEKDFEKDSQRLYFPKRTERVTFCDVDYTHGDVGINGAKPSPSSFTKLPMKVSHGHTHSPYILHDVYCKGTASKKNMGYNAKGYSSWSHCHEIMYTNGERDLVFVIDGKWCFDEELN